MPKESEPYQSFVKRAQAEIRQLSDIGAPNKAVDAFVVQVCSVLGKIADVAYHEGKVEGMKHVNDMLKESLKK